MEQMTNEERETIKLQIQMFTPMSEGLLNKLSDEELKRYYNERVNKGGQ